MLQVIENVVGALEQGRVGRREAVARLVAVVAAAAGAGPAFAGRATAAETKPAQAATSTFRAHGLNHAALRVTDLDRSQTFYERHLGMRVTSRSQWNRFLDCGGGHFLALFKSDRAGMDHLAFTIDPYRADDAESRARTAGLTVRRAENRVYFDDPDGIELQVSPR